MRREDDTQAGNLQPKNFVAGSDQQLLYLDDEWPPVECLTYQHPDDGISYETDNGRAHAFQFTEILVDEAQVLEGVDAMIGHIRVEPQPQPV